MDTNQEVKDLKKQVNVLTWIVASMFVALCALFIFSLFIWGSHKDLKKEAWGYYEHNREVMEIFPPSNTLKINPAGSLPRALREEFDRDGFNLNSIGPIAYNVYITSSEVPTCSNGLCDISEGFLKITINNRVISERKIKHGKCSFRKSDYRGKGSCFSQAVEDNRKVVREIILRYVNSDFPK